MHRKPEVAVVSKLISEKKKKEQVDGNRQEWAIPPSNHFYKVTVHQYYLHFNIYLKYFGYKC